MNKLFWECDGQYSRPLAIPRYYDEPVRRFALRLSILLAQSPVSKTTVYNCVNEFIGEIRDAEANGFNLSMIGFSPELATLLEQNGILTDRQLLKLTYNQVENLPRVGQIKARWISKEIARLDLRKLAKEPA